MASGRTAIRLDMPEDPAAAICRKWQTDQGIEIYAVAGNNDFSSPIPDIANRQLVSPRELMRMTADLGAKVMRVFLAWPGVTLLPRGRRPARHRKGGLDRRNTKSLRKEQTWDWSSRRASSTAKLAGDAGVVLALQNHPPVIRGYRDTLRMVREVGSAHLRICFDARLEHELDEVGVRKAVNEIGSQQSLWHYGGEYPRRRGHTAQG